MDVSQQLIAVWQSQARKSIVQFRNPLEIWEENPTYLLCEVVFLIWAYLTLRHAFKHRGRYLLLWLTSLLHGLVVEHLSYFMPDIDSFWHGQMTVMLSWGRMPLHIPLVYVCFHYTANVAAMRLKLHVWSEPFAAALGALLLDVPFDIMGVKLLWWSWHDTDPYLFARTYNVPWTSYIFHLAFGSTFSLLLNGSRLVLTGSADREKTTDNYFLEFVCVILTGMLTMPLAIILQFLPLFNIPHDIYGVDTEVCAWLTVGIYVFVVWSADRVNNTDARPSQASPGARPKHHSYFDEISLAVIVHFVFHILLVLLATPENYRSTGLHQTIGDCNHVSYINTITGKSLPKKTYLCLENYDEPYFSFHCLPGGLPPNTSSHYTICGTPYPNTTEYEVAIIASSLFGMAVFYQWLCRSGPAWPHKIKKA